MKYKLFRECLLDENGNKYTTYGIKAVEKGRTVSKVSDVGCNWISVLRLCRKCNRLKLDIVHLQDVAEDFAAEC